MKKTKTTPFDPARWTPEMQVVDETGEPIRVLCVDAPSIGHPIIAIRQYGSEPDVARFRPDQLRFVEPIIMVWINYYGSRCQAFEYKTKEEADETAFVHRIACFETEKTW